MPTLEIFREKICIRYLLKRSVLCHLMSRLSVVQKKGYIVSSQKSTCRIFKEEIYNDGLQRKRHKSVTTTPPTVREY